MYKTWVFLDKNHIEWSTADKDVVGNNSKAQGVREWSDYLQNCIMDLYRKFQDEDLRSSRMTNRPTDADYRTLMAEEKNIVLVPDQD